MELESSHEWDSQRFGIEPIPNAVCEAHVGVHVAAIYCEGIRNHLEPASASAHCEAMGAQAAKD